MDYQDLIELSEEIEINKSKPVTEEELESYIISLFESQGYFHSKGSDIKRENYYEVLLIEDLTNFLKPRYPKLDTYFEIYSDIRHIADDLHRDDKNFYEFNRDFFKKLSDEIIYTRERDGEKLPISLIDFQNPENNIFRIVNQFAVEGKNPRRVDLVVYINGIPLVVWELKSPSDGHVGLVTAHQQLQLYQKEIPDLFKYNAFSVLCDGIHHVKYGVNWESLENFMEWKKISDEVSSEGKDRLDVLIQGLFAKERIIKYIENFIWFKDSDPKEKIIGRYPQFFGATKMFASILKNLKPKGSGKGGIYFGTTGCGKSYTMLFLSRLLLNSESLNTPSILIISDRVEISEQLCKLFQSSTNYLGDKNIEDISSRQKLTSSLKKLVQGGVFLTNLQKFEESCEILSERNNIICISDEAHRSNHNFDVELKEGGGETCPFAKRLHESLPNATYVGFTATPIDQTMDVFGEIVDRYTMDESISDGFTVKLKLEVKKGWLKLQDEIALKIIEKYREARETGTSEECIEEDQRIRTKLKAICNVQSRIEKITDDIVEHYEARVNSGETVCGKAMIVTVGRDIGYKVWRRIREIRPEWTIKENEAGMSKVQLVMTRAKSDGEEMYQLIGNDEYQKKLAREFKKEDSDFKIAIVSDKWLTGFDAPCLDTMYLDRIFQDKTLIQAVSRVNRKYLRKNYGLVVSYWPIEKYWKDAINKVGGSQRGGCTLEEVISATKDKLELLNKLFHDFDRKTFLSIHNENDQSGMVVSYIREKGKQFQDKFSELYFEFIHWYDSWSSVELSKELGQERAFYKLIYKYWSRHIKKSWTPMSEKTKQEISEHMQNIFFSGEMSQHSFGYLNVSFPSEQEYKNKEVTRDDKQRKAKKLGEALAKIHKSFGRNFLERLAKLQDEYESLYEAQGRLEAIEDEEERKKAMQEFNLEERLKALDEKRDELVDEGYRKMKEHEIKGWTQEEQVFFDQLKEFNENFGFGLEEKQLLDFTRDLNELWNERKGWGDPIKRFTLLSQLKMDIYNLIDKYNFYISNETFDNTDVVIVEELVDCFRRMTESSL
ncbi:type I restriction endonuclease [Mycoplasma ovis str. Michigan]|uniref:Type I restriction enzyme endonuclease subunit n=1 Tax=Mycoplasma ovis str. Michigan TaxID=1415773 RepID=A0ABN4BQ40_9MOLU|nr:HsdR family type I site-specific deoxyribonuclease [Mycoplasma ovis]AHC39993.1 type I restriction endonuclease [Mycoplasma ovis str. Michigan]